MPPIFIFRFLLAGVVFGFSLIAASAAPAHVLIRVPAGQPMPVELTPLLSSWRKAGHVAGVLLLTQGRSEKSERTAKFESLAVLEFSNEQAYTTWQHESAPSLPVGLIVRRADILAHDQAENIDHTRAIFVVNTYAPKVAPARFIEFVQGYVKPLYEAMFGTKHLIRYTAYLERGELGQADAINVLEYRDAAAFSAITAIKTNLRDQVAAAVPTYIQFDKIKDTLRVDGFGTTANYTQIP